VADVNLPENPTEEEYQAWLADPDTPPLPELQWAHRILNDELPFCGCGSPEDAWAWLRRMLELFDRDSCEDWGARWAEIKAHVGIADETGDEEDFDVVRSGAAEILLNLPGHAGLTEHGTSAGGSWLTDKGRRFLAVMQAVGYDDLRYVGFPEEENPGAYELVEYGGMHMVRKVADKSVAFQTGDIEAARTRLAELNRAPA
jgi:hypothetical protein